MNVSVRKVHRVHEKAETYPSGKPHVRPSDPPFYLLLVSGVAGSRSTSVCLFIHLKYILLFHFPGTYSSAPQHRRWWEDI